jgi:hypothetical protein
MQQVGIDLDSMIDGICMGGMVIAFLLMRVHISQYFLWSTLQEGSNCMLGQVVGRACVGVLRYPLYSVLYGRAATRCCSGISW